MAYTEWADKESFPEKKSLETLAKEAKEIPMAEETFRLLDRYFSAMANLYGVIPLRDAFAIVRDLEGETVSAEEFLSFADIARHRRDPYEIIGEGGPEGAKGSPVSPDWEIIHSRVALRGPEEYYFLVEAQSGKPFRMLPREDFLGYGEPDAFENTPEYLKVADVFMSHATGDEDSKKSALDEILYSARSTGFSVDDAPNMFHAFKVGFPGAGELEEFRKAFVEYFNETPNMSNRGLSPSEFAAEETPEGYQPTAEQNNRAGWMAIQAPSHGPEGAEAAFMGFGVPCQDFFRPQNYEALGPSKAKASLGAPANTPVEKRVPRNAPCPCGSGKKYKNCCGRKVS